MQETPVLLGSGRSSGEGIGYPLLSSWFFLVAQLVKNPPVMQETWVRSLSWEDLLEQGKATHSSILAWGIPWTRWQSVTRLSHEWHGVAKSRTRLSNFHFASLQGYKGGFSGGSSGKEPACQCRRCKRHRFYPWVGKISWSRKWQTVTVFLPG